MDEEKEIEEVKNKIDEEIGELEARLKGEQEELEFKLDFFSEDSKEVEAINNRIERVVNDLESFRWLQELGKERLIEVRRRKQQEQAEKHRLAMMRHSAHMTKLRFLEYTEDVLRRRFREQELIKEKQYKTIEDVLMELVKNSDKRVREQLKIILKKWEKRVSFIDGLHESGLKIPNLLITKAERRRDAKLLNKHIKAHPEPLLYYLYKTKQMTDLTEGDIIGINEWVRSRKKEDPFCNVEEIRIKKQIYEKREVEHCSEKMEA